MIENKTIPSNRKVTRTIEVMNLNVTVIDMTDKSVVDIPLSIPALGYRTTKALEKTIIDHVNEKNENYKYVTHTLVDKQYITYAMSEAQYLALAKPVAMGTDIKHMTKIETPNLEDEDERPGIQQ